MGILKFERIGIKWVGPKVIYKGDACNEKASFGNMASITT